MKVKGIQYLCLISVFLLNALAIYAQTQSLQVGIVSNTTNNRFCKGIPKLFNLEAKVTGGTAPYRYEWTFSWRTDTIRTPKISITPVGSGEVRLKVTDSSLPPITRDIRYPIYETNIVADFTFSPDNSCAQSPVIFTSQALGGTPEYKYSWSFGDGYGSTERNPSHAFNASGCSGVSAFSAQLFVTDADGCSATVIKPVTVRNKPTLSFDDSANPYSPFKHCPEIMIDPTFDIVLENQTQITSCITSYRIDWGDGSIGNNAVFPARHTYTRAGAFEIIITAENSSGCSLTWTHFVYNQSSPAAGIESLPGTEGCAPKELPFHLVGYENNSVGTTYTWDFGDKTPLVVWQHDAPYSKDTIKHVYNTSSCTQPGMNFTTQVIVSNGCGTKTAAVNGIRIWIKPQASIDKRLAQDTICVNESIQLSNRSINGYYGSNCSTLSQYLWDLDNGTTLNTANIAPVSWSVPGTYDVVLKVSNPCGITTDTFKIVVIEPPVARATIDPASGCAPFIPKFRNSSTGYKKYLWEVTPGSGYSFLNGTSGKSWEPEISFNRAGTYRVVLHVSNTCRTDSVVFNLNVFAQPSGSISNLNNVCITNPLVHPSAAYLENGSPVRSFNWSFPGGSPQTATGLDPGVHTYSVPGEYIVSLTMENGCGSGIVTDTLIVQATPVITLNTPVTICESDSLVITGTVLANASSFRWQTLGDGYFTNAAILNPVYHPGKNDVLSSGTSLRIIANGLSPCGTDTSDLKLSILRKPVVKVDNDVTVCEGNAYTIANTTATNYSALLWSTSGDGHFSDPAILLPSYIPGRNDISTGHVELTLTARGQSPCTSAASDSFVITYARGPSLEAGSDRDICANGQVSLSASGSGFTSVNWHVDAGKGTFSNPAALSTEFTITPGITDTLLILTIEATGGYGCPSFHDTLKLRVIPLPVVSAGDDGLVCESGTYELKGALVREYLSFSWTVSGDGTLDNNSLLNPVYTPGLADIASGSVRLTLIAKGNSVCPDVSDAVDIIIRKLPVADAGPDQEVCKSNNFITAGSQANGSSARWITLGTGTFANATELNATYYPSDSDKAAGIADLVLQVNALAPCVSPDYDTVRLRFIDIPVISAGNDTTICSSSFRPGSAFALNSTQYLWSSDGGGTWTNANTLTPVYYPSAADVTAGSVVLTLASRNSACPVVSDDMKLTLIPFPVSEAGKDDVVCEDNVKTLSDAYSSNFTSMEWRTSGDGRFNDPSALHAIYEPGAGDIGAGSVKLYLVVTGRPPCHTPAIDSMTISIQKNPVVNAGPDALTGEGDPFSTAGATVQNVSKVSWTTLGDGSFINGSGVVTTYLHGQHDLLNGSVSLIIRGTSNSPCTRVVSDTMRLLITPKPKTDAGLDEKICEGSNVTISTASATEYSEIWWTTTGNGLLENEKTLTPTYHPNIADIANRMVVLRLHARGKRPIENYIVTDSMRISIVHNALAEVIPLDTACGNFTYRVADISYSDANSISWSSSGNGIFDGTGQEHPVYAFSPNDRSKDTIRFFVSVTSIAPCVHFVRDTLLLRLYHEPVPSFDLNTYEGCAPLDVAYTNTSTGEELKFHWNFGNGLESTLKDPGSTIFQQSMYADTVYKITLEAANRCSTVATSRDVVVKPVPVADFGMDVTWGCSPKDIRFFNVTTGLADNYLWNWGDGKENSVMENPGSHLFETGINDTTYTITLRAQNECGVDSMRKSVVILPNKVKAFFESDTTLGCAPLEVSFTNFSRGVLGNRPFLNWSWNFGDGSVSDKLNPVHVFKNPGKYKVTLFVNDTCSRDSFTTEIDVLGSPRVDFITDRTDYCQYDTVSVAPINMSLDKIAGVSWDFGDSGLGTDFTEQHNYATSGLFTITLTAKDINNGCTASVSKKVNIHPAPVAAFDTLKPEGYHPFEYIYQNQTTGGVDFSWDFGDGGSSHDKNTWHAYDSSGIYLVRLIAENEFNCSDTTFKQVEIRYSSGLNMPNALAPDNASAGVREFKAVGAGLLEYHLVIYDTWGNLIWETTRLEEGKPVEAWDGTLNGKLLPPDVYVWHLKKVVFAGGEPYSGPRYGSILLIK